MSNSDREGAAKFKIQIQVCVMSQALNSCKVHLSVNTTHEYVNESQWIFFFLDKLNVTDSVINKVTEKSRQKEADM